MSFVRRLKNRCAILQPTVTGTNEWRNKTTQYIAPSTPVDLRAVPCFFYPGTGQESNDAQRVVSVDIAYFDFEKDTPVRTVDRIDFNNQIYEIIQVSPVGGGHHLVVEARQVKLNGTVPS